jgi:type IV secretion system protein TrbL
MSKNYKLLFSIILIFLFLGISSVYAQAPNNNSADSIIALYKNTADSWVDTLTGYAVRLFFLLALIELTWSGARLALEGADIQQLASELVRRILFIGIFYWILLNGSDFAQIIIDSFRQAANDASNFDTMKPADIIDAGIDASVLLLSNISLFDPQSITVIGITAVIIVICLAWIGAVLVVTLIETYITISAGILLLGFGGSQWTNDIARKFIMYVVSVGMKLFILQLLIGTGLTLLTGLADNFNPREPNYLVMVSVAIIMLILCLKLPETVQGFVNGSALGATSSVGQAARIITSAASATATAVTGAATATMAAAQLTGAQQRSGDRSSGIMSALGGTASNLMSSLSSTATDRMAGVPNAQYGSISGTATQRMRDAAASLNASSSGSDSNSDTKSNNSKATASSASDGQSKGSSENTYPSPLNNDTKA